jgi:hypothetical protein
MLTWCQKTWGERLQTVFAAALAGIICLGGFIGGILVIGMIIDGEDHRREEHHRCLKNATNGLEIEQCR